MVTQTHTELVTLLFLIQRIIFYSPSHYSIYISSNSTEYIHSMTSPLLNTARQLESHECTTTRRGHEQHDDDRYTVTVQ